MNINGKQISVNNKPYLIAEMSGNHKKDFSRAIEIIDKAKANGADAVKFQTYKPETITMNMKSEAFKVKDKLWSGRYLWDVYDEGSMPWEMQEELFKYCKEISFTAFSSPFDLTAIEFLERIDVPAYKIASFEILDLELISECCKTGKPVIISTGMASYDEIDDAINVATKYTDKSNLCLLHCISGYPSKPEDYNLKKIPELSNRYGVKVGLSDHTEDNLVPLLSVPLGACVIEKHITLSKNDGALDSKFSMDPNQLKELSAQLNIASKTLKGEKRISEGEMNNRLFRRSLYFAKDLKKGEVIDRDAIKSIRPGDGLKPKYLSDVIGKQVSQDVFYGTPILKEKIIGFQEE